MSFGLFIPPRILNSAKYRGLNVHPSLLPDYRGSSPIASAVINRDTTTGITLQDLSPEAFDHGKILARIHLPIANPESVTTAALTEQILKPASDILIAGLQAGLYQHERTQALPPPQLGYAPREAKKFTKSATQLRCGMSALEAEARRRALGALWYVREVSGRKGKVMEQRVLLDDVSIVPSTETGEIRGVVVIEKMDDGEKRWECKARICEDGTSVDLLLPGEEKALRVHRATVSGGKQMAGIKAIIQS